MNILKEILKEIVKELPESKIEVVPNDPKDQEVADQMNALLRYQNTLELQMDKDEMPDFEYVPIILKRLKRPDGSLMWAFRIEDLPKDQEGKELYE